MATTIWQRIRAEAEAREEAIPIQRGVTLRAVVIGVILAPLIAWFNISIEAIRYAGQPTTISLFPHVLFVLLVLIAGNAVVGRIIPRWRFSPAELMTVYFFALMTAVMASHDLIEVITPILTYPFKYANPANRWASEVIPYLPKWLFVSDPDAVDKYYIGNANFWNARDLRIWTPPLLIWTGFFTVLAFGMFCLNVLLRKQWTDRERLSYPLVQLPLELVQPRVPVFQNRLFWIAFTIAAVNDIWFGLNRLFPSIPQPYVRWQTLEQYITTPPWNAIGWLPLAFFPWIVGIGVLLPTDLLFSCWFFFWMWKFQPIVAAYYGWNQIPGFPYVNEQSFGAYMGIALFTIYTARKALAHGFSAIWRGSDGTDKGEALPYRWAGVGFLASLAVLYLFFLSTGMSGWVIALSLFIYLAISLAVTRMRAELGPPAHDLHDSGPQRLIPLLFGVENLKRQELVMFAPIQGFNRAYRAHPMPTHIEGLRAAERTRSSMQAMFWVLVFAVFWGTLTGFFVNVHLHYHWGAASKADTPYVSTIFGREPYDRITSLLSGSVSSLQKRNVIWAMMVGFGVTAVLSLFRMNIPNFPFHPVGYAISSSWSLSVLWFSLLVAWVCKVTIMKIGGLRTYQRALPFFLGLVLGECTMGSLWMLISIFTGTKTFIVWPYG